MLKTARRVIWSAFFANALAVGAIVIAWLMWKYVEEPAREWMRRRSGERPKPVEEIALETDGLGADGR